jgi:hypothetical protein
VIRFYSRFFTTSKAVCFRAALVQLHPSPRRCAAFPVLSCYRLSTSLPSRQSRRAIEEKTMKIITIALLINAIAELIAAFAKFINAIRHRK